jgi:hypothetical protein
MFFDPHHRLELAAAHADELRRVGAKSRTPTPGSPRDGAVSDLAIVIRPNRRDDERALARLAGLDSAAVPDEPLLVAEVGGQLRAALSLRDSAVIADPFRHTAQLVTLLQMRAEQLRAEPSGRGRWLARARARLAPAR